MRLGRLIAAFLGLGFFPVAPGTLGSAAALVPGLLLLRVSPGLLALGVLAVTLVGLWAIRAARAADDPGWVVIDEVAGQWIALLGLPHSSWLGALLAFAAFRLFDVTKPGPVGAAERLPGALGVMADDLLAGVLAALLLLVLRWAAPGWIG